MKTFRFYSSTAVAVVGMSQMAQSATLAVSDSMIVQANGAVVTPNADLPTDAANVSNETSWEYVARERENVGQTNRRIATFLQFDTSTITVAEVNTLGFTATFSIDHVGHLNPTNNGGDLWAGYNDSGAWDSSGGSNPDFAWAAASESQAILLEDIHLYPQGAIGAVDPPLTLTLDVTPLVQGWVNGTIANQGVVLFLTPANPAGNQSQASFLSNASIETGVVPEPSSLALAGLGLFGLLARRRR